MRIAKQVFLPLALFFLGYFAWQSRAMLVDVVRDASVVKLALAAGIWSIMNGASAIFSTQIFRARGAHISYATAARIHIENLPARYIPGGVWHTVGRAASFRELGIGNRDIAIFVFLENVLAICTAFVLGGSLLISTRGFDGWGQIAFFAALGGAALLIAAPLILATRVVRENARFPTRTFILATVLAFFSWCVAALAFVTYLSAFPGIAEKIAPFEIAGSYLFSWGVGFIAIFAPQGVGVFEVVAADLMRGTDSLMGIAALLAGFRLIILLADLATFLSLRAWTAIAHAQAKNHDDQVDGH